MRSLLSLIATHLAALLAGLAAGTILTARIIRRKTTPTPSRSITEPAHHAHTTYKEVDTHAAQKEEALARTPDTRILERARRLFMRYH